MFIKKTLEKFKENKIYRYFPGSTIIHFINNERQIKVLESIRDEMNNFEIYKKFCLLPVESYHMTVCDIVTYKDITSNEMFNTFKYRLAKTIDEADKLIYNELEDILVDLNITMIPAKIKSKKIVLKPKTEDDKLKLENFRKEVSSRLGFSLPENYTFHISLAYQLQELTDYEQEELDKFLEYLNYKYLADIKEIKVDEINYTIFNDMSEYGLLENGRINLGQAKIEYLNI